DPPASLKVFNVDPLRTRKLLLKKREISQLQKLKEEKGLTIIMTSMYWKENHIKCDIATGKGKKLHDQRQDIKKRDWERDQGRILKNAKNNSLPSKNFK
ncbi:SsrA-binding protein, partial [Gammaproteobacteria bacterium]|nr:SsrA-binding protein [Gammaproteobacteria bacterium]